MTMSAAEKAAEIAGLTDESVCPTSARKGFAFCGAGAFACQPILSQLLRQRFLTGNKIQDAGVQIFKRPTSMARFDGII
jgi:hypothetical protein